MTLAAGKGLTPTSLRERCEQDARDYELSKALFPKLFSSQTVKHPQTDARQRDTTKGPALADHAGSSLALGAATSNPGGDTGPGGDTAPGAGAAGPPASC